MTDITLALYQFAEGPSLEYGLVVYTLADGCGRIIGVALSEDDIVRRVANAWNLPRPWTMRRHELRFGDGVVIHEWGEAA